jgi:ligand-binding SRPBCC domain-containing protein
MHHLHREQILHCSLDEAWEFFATPRNLDRLTPDTVGFKITYCESEVMHPGQMIGYKVKVAPAIWVDWLTEITYVDEKVSFVDDQRIGPYKVWHHTHRFQETADGVLMTDDIIYELPFGPLGKLVHELYVKNQLEYIFNERKRLTDEIFNTNPHS